MDSIKVYVISTDVLLEYGSGLYLSKLGNDYETNERFKKIAEEYGKVMDSNLFVHSFNDVNSSDLNIMDDFIYIE